MLLPPLRRQSSVPNNFHDKKYFMKICETVRPFHTFIQTVRYRVERSQLRIEIMLYQSYKK